MYAVISLTIDVAAKLVLYTFQYLIVYHAIILYFGVLLPIVSILLCIAYMNSMVFTACKWLFMPFVIDA